MKIIATTCLCGLAFALCCFADPASPYGSNLLSDKNNLEIKPDQWTLSQGVLSKNSLLYFGDRFLIVKEEVVKVPAWYSLRCDLVNIAVQNGSLPHAGLVFGFVNETNYTAVLFGEELKVIQVKDGKTLTETSVPVRPRSNRAKAELSVEVRHWEGIEVYVDGSLVLSQKFADGIPQGRVGLTLQSGICAFSNATISGIAKR